MKSWLATLSIARLQYSLKTAFLVSSLIAVCFAPIANHLNSLRVRQAIATGWARRGARLIWDPVMGRTQMRVSRIEKSQPGPDSVSCGYSRLQSVRMCGPGFNASDVAKLSYFSVARLEIEEIELDSHAVQTIASQRDLKELYFVNCKVTPRDLAALRALDDLRLLSLRGQPVSEIHLDALESLQGLRVCDIEGGQVGAPRLRQFLQNSSIEIVRVSHCPLTVSERSNLRDSFREKVLFFE